MVLYCHLGCNGNSSGPLKSTFGIIFIQFQNPVNFCFCLLLFTVQTRPAWKTKFKHQIPFQFCLQEYIERKFSGAARQICGQRGDLWTQSLQKNEKQDMNSLRTYLWCKTKKCFLFLNLGGLLLKTILANFIWIYLEAKSASGGQKVDRFVTAGEVAEMGAASMKRYT